MSKPREISDAEKLEWELAEIREWIDELQALITDGIAGDQEIAIRARIADLNEQAAYLIGG